MISMSGCWFCTKWNWEQRNQPILDIPPPPSFVAITVVGVEPRTGTISFEENMTTPIFRCLLTLKGFEFGDSATTYQISCSRQKLEFISTCRLTFYAEFSHCDFNLNRLRMNYPK